MRVRLLNTAATPQNTVNATPCGLGGYGQIEDYLINVSSALGVNDLSKNQVKTYPNPVENNYFIESNSAIKEIQVLDFSGKMVFKKTNETAKANVDFSTMSPGAYLVRIIQKDDSVHAIKVIKN